LFAKDLFSKELAETPGKVPWQGIYIYIYVDVDTIIFNVTIIAPFCILGVELFLQGVMRQGHVGIVFVMYNLFCSQAKTWQMRG